MPLRYYYFENDSNSTYKTRSWTYFICLSFLLILSNVSWRHFIYFLCYCKMTKNNSNISLQRANKRIIYIWFFNVMPHKNTWSKNICMFIFHERKHYDIKYITEPSSLPIEIIIVFFPLLLSKHLKVQKFF